MNVEIGTEAAQFPEKEYINGIYVRLPYITYVMQSGRFSQYPADGKRAG